MFSHSITRFGKTSVSAFVLILIAFSWLAFPYVMNGELMMFETGEQVKSDRRVAHSALSQFLTRQIRFPSTIEVKALYASEEYFEYADKANAVGLYRPDTHYVFFVNEEVHTGELPVGLPKATLEVDGKSYEPVSIEGPDVVEHHRTTIVRFSKLDSAGNPIGTAASGQLNLKLSHKWIPFAVAEDGKTVLDITGEYLWDLPLNIPQELLSKNFFNTAMIFSMSAGLLAAVLTPCLLQLGVVFLATLGGMGAKEASAGQGLTAEVRKKIIWAAAGFVIGYIILFVGSGALIGYIGKEAQLWFANYTRPVGIGAGVVIILFGIWLGIRSRAPLVCRMPGASMIQNTETKGILGTILVSIAFSLGCMSCFGGAIIGTLFIYVGALGSATTGAAVMGMFAAGVAIPFMLAAVFFSKMNGLFAAVQRHSQTVGMVSTVVIIGFGLLLVTDNFHTISDLIYPYLGLS